ncbi:MAG TPA: DUF6629 family protein [Acidimicrobiia bacterium]|nr:DUF6629 family protein [Acidimicrobiia bacterium]
MCFSAEADFASGAVIGVIGVATLTKVKHPREIPLAALPLAFAAHQVVEGFVWRDLDAGDAHATGAAVTLYVVFAWILLPVLAPLAIMLLEPPGRVRRRIGALVVVGAVASVYLGAAVVAGDVSAHATEHTLQYGGAGKYAWLATVFYVVATCGAPLLSGFRAIVWFGVANLVAVGAIVVVQSEGLTSVWCAWAAVVSVLIFLQFTWWRNADAAAAELVGATPRSSP